MKRPEFTCDRCGARSNSDPYVFLPYQWNSITEEVHTKKLSAMDRSVASIMMCKSCKDKVVGYIRGGIENA